MTESVLKDRFKQYSLDIYRLTQQFPKEPAYKVVEFQILKASTSSFANYWAACRAKSKPDFTNKLKIVEEELDETIFWLEYLLGLHERWQPLIKSLSKEGEELLSIIIASIKTSQKKSKV